MPTTNMNNPPGRHMPAMPARAPERPRRRSPTRMAMFVEFNPGSDWLMESSSTKALSSSQARFATRPLRRYATTPPPKLVAPIRRNSRKICKTVAEGPPGLIAGEGWVEDGAEGSLMALRGVAFQAIDHAGFCGA